MSSKFEKCAKDFVYFCSLLKITNPREGRWIPFELYGYQNQIFLDCEIYPRNIIKKARQVGITELMTAYYTWKFAFHENQKLLMVAERQHQAVAMSELVKRNLYYLTRYSKIEIPMLDKFPSPSNNNRRKCSATGNVIDFMQYKNVRSCLADSAYIDEAAYISGIKKDGIWWAKDLKNLTIASTINKPDGWFERAFENAENLGLHPTKISYKDCPRYQDQDYLKQLKESLGEQSFRLEILGQF